MAQPTPFTRSYSFADNAYSGSQVDQQFDRAIVTLDQVLHNLEALQRDDEELANETVGYDQLKPELRLGFVPPTAWVAGTVYSIGSTVFYGDSFYGALVAHTAGTSFEADLAAGYWELIADFGDIFTGLLTFATQTEVNTGTEPAKAVAPATLLGRGQVSPQTNYTVLPADLFKVVSIDASGGARTVTLPSAATVGNGAEVTIHKSDESGNFVTINSVNSELLGYPSKSYALHATPGTAVSNNGGFVRIRMIDDNRIFVTGDLGRISETAGFAALNADHVVTRPTSASGRSADSVDLTVPYVAGYTGGGKIQWIQKSQRIRVCNGLVTYVSNGNHWLVKTATSDVWQGPKDFLFGERNSGYTGPVIAGVHSAGAAGKIEALQNAFGHRGLFESLALIQSADPVDLIIGRMGRIDGIMSEATATSILNGEGVGAIYFVGSDQNGNVSTRMAFITGIAGEDITTAGSGGTLRLGTTPVGEAAGLGRIEIRATGKVWLGGQEDRGTIAAEPSLLSASGVLSGAVNASDGETVTIDAVVYTFRTAPSAAFSVLIGGTAKASLINLASAINLTGTAGTTYGAATTIHPTVHGIGGLGGNNVLNVYAKVQGAAGNAIATTEVSAYSWADVTLTGGADANTTHLDVSGGVAGDPKVTLLANSTITGINAVAMRLATRGTAYVHTNDPFIPFTSVHTGLTTAGNETYTAAQVIGGLIVRDCNGGARSDTLPAAAALVAAIPGCAIGDTVRTYIVNGSDAAETLTLTEGAGGGWAGAQLAASRVIPQNASKLVHFRLTNVTAASEAYVVFA